MDEHSFTIEAVPVPASRPQVAKYGTYYPKPHMAYKGLLEALFDKIKRNLIEGPFEVRFLFVQPPWKTSTFPTSRSDVDNLAKLPMDVMTKKQFWIDDCLAVSLVALKRFCREDEEPHTKVRIIKIEGSVEDHVDKAFFA